MNLEFIRLIVVLIDKIYASRSEYVIYTRFVSQGRRAEKRIKEVFKKKTEENFETLQNIPSFRQGFAFLIAIDNDSVQQTASLTASETPTHTAFLISMDD